jgi:hypothetical protein
LNYEVAILSLTYPLLLLSWPDDDDLLRDTSHALGGGFGVAYIVLSDNPSSQYQTNLNKWFRLTLRGDGRTFLKQGVIGARGARSASPLGQSAWAGPRSGSVFTCGPLVPSRCVYSWSPLWLSSGVFWSLLEFILFVFS